MTHRLRFLPLALILVGVTIGLAVHPSDSPAQSGASVDAATVARGDARTMRRADAALRIARRARLIARRGLAQANAVLATAEQASADAAAAKATADAAQTTADAAQTTADDANDRLDAAAVASDEDPTAVTTGSTADYVDLGGPSVTVEVPASGLVEIWATVRFDDPSDGQVALFEDGQLVPIPGQELTCSPGGTLGDVLLSFSGGAGFAQTLSTPPAPDFGVGCGVIGSAPGSVLFDRTPGVHTYELRYADCGCEPGIASFSDRLLRAAGRE